MMMKTNLKLKRTMTVVQKSRWEKLAKKIKKSTKDSAPSGSAAAASDNYTKKLIAPMEKISQGGALTESDVEFMKKAI